MNALGWFEIPAADFDRATRFYEQVLGVQMVREVFMGTPNAFFPYDRETGVGGSIIKMDDVAPSASGTLVYLNAATPERLDEYLGRVEQAGGKVLVPQTHIGEAGHMAIFLDSEGNRVGLHAPNVK
ncbi:MAG: VOC family protein [bacterium]|nr:VOC family protein [bacterium]